MYELKRQTEDLSLLYNICNYEKTDRFHYNDPCDNAS